MYLLQLSGCTYSDESDVRNSKDPGITHEIWLSYRFLFFMKRTKMGKKESGESGWYNGFISRHVIGFIVYGIVITYRVFNWCRPKNILLETSLILFSANCRSCMWEAPSKAFASIPLIWFRLKSSFTKWGNRPNSPSDVMRPNSLSFNSLKRFLF